jgi:hypothetical protein
MRPSDAEFVERVRRSIAWYERFRWPAVIFYLALTAGLIGLGVALFNFIQAAPMPGVWPGFFIGVILGALFGKLAYKIGHGLAIALTGSHRSEELLVRYHDALHEVAIKSVQDKNIEPLAAPDRGEPVV